MIVHSDKLSDMGKKVKKDEKGPPEDIFDPILVESRQAATVVLMLNSPEEDVLAKACEAIYKFVDKCEYSLTFYSYHFILIFHIHRMWSN